MRRWAFDSDEGTTPQDTPVKLVLSGRCQGPIEILRSIERPTPEPTRCMVGDADKGHVQNQHYGLDFKGRLTGASRAVVLQHENTYVDAGAIPGMKDQASVSAWIYVYSAGDQNFILSKGAWNEAYALTLDRGRLRFNVGEHFARTNMPVPAQRWAHVVGTFDGVQIRVYVDGVEEIPRARYISGGATRDMLWRSRNADGPLDQQYAWESPLPPSSSPTVRGREITFATRVIGAETKLAGDTLQFELKPGATVYLVSSVLSDLDDWQHVKAAQARVQAVTPAELQKLNSALRDWWKNFWSESFVEIGDKVIEKFYYMSHYIIASAARTGKVAPGLYGPWVTVDTPNWNGDYTLDYNHQMPYYGLYSSNHIATTDPYDPPVLAMVERARQYARTLLGVRGLLMPTHIGPWGMERPFNYETFVGRKDDAAYVTVNMLMRFYHTYDPEYARLVYPFIRETGEFWEDYLVREGDRFAIVNSCSGEAGVWNSRPDFNTCRDQKNAPLVVSHVRGVFKGLIDISTELGVDAGRRVEWQYILDRLPEVPTGGGRRPDGGSGNSAGAQFGSGMGGLDQDASVMLKTLRDQVERVAYPNGYPFRPGGGVESASVIPQRINGMLLQDTGGIQVFAAWPKDQDARFGRLRTIGAFLVSSEFRKGEVTSLLIESERGRACTLFNPWPGKAMVFYRAGNNKKGERLTGDKVTFKTSSGEHIEVRPL